MKRSLLIVSVVAAVFVIVAFLVGGRALVLEGLIFTFPLLLALRRRDYPFMS